MAASAGPCTPISNQGTLSDAVALSVVAPLSRVALSTAYCLAPRVTCLAQTRAGGLAALELDLTSREGRVFRDLVVKLCIGAEWVSSVGWARLALNFLLICTARPYGFWRLAIKLPAHNQRTRSNGKTAARLEYEGLADVLASFGVARLAVGKEAGATAHKQKIKAKLRPKVVRTAVSKRKAPVVRSRDTKKSAWR